jgi:hypothetical protein
LGVGGAGRIQGETAVEGWRVTDPVAGERGLKSGRCRTLRSGIDERNGAGGVGCGQRRGGRWRILTIRAALPPDKLSVHPKSDGKPGHVSKGR